VTTNNNHNHPLTDAVDSIATAVDEALVIAVDSRSPDALLARLATARAGIVKVDLITHVIDVPGDMPRVYADELPPGAKPKALDLPKLKPLPSDTRKWDKQRPGIGAKLKSPKAFDCPTCRAEAGTNCFKFTTQGKHGKPTDVRNHGTSFHSARSARRWSRERGTQDRTGAAQELARDRDSYADHVEGVQPHHRRDRRWVSEVGRAGGTALLVGADRRLADRSRRRRWLTGDGSPS
jgi:hypothetical protein